MKVPCEIIMWYGLPAIRREFAKIMMEKYGLNQKEVAAKLGITDAAVSQYLSAKRGKIKISDGKIQSEIRESAKKIVDGNESTMIKEMCRICEILKSLITMKPFMQKALGKYRQHTTLLGLFFLGILFQFVDMPCATPMFMMVLSKILLNANIQNFLLLFIFGFGVITPFVALGIIGSFTPQLANKFRLKIRMNYGEKVRVVSSLILIGLGIWLMISIF